MKSPIENHLPPHDPNALPEYPEAQDEEASPEAFFKRMESIWEDLKKVSDHPIELYKTDQVAFEEYLNEIVDDIAGKQDSCIEARKARKQAKPQSDAESQLTEVIKDIYSKIRQIVLSEAGLPDESLFVQIEAAKNNVTSLLATPASGSPITNSRRALEELGIYNGIKDGKEQYQFPYNLMPQLVIEKWEIYIAAVCKHSQAKNQGKTNSTHNMFGKPVVYIDEDTANKARTFAHDATTRDVNAILAFPEKGMVGWDYGKTRELLGKIITCLLPTIESGSDNHANACIAAHNDGVSVAELLSTSRRAYHTE